MITLDTSAVVAFTTQKDAHHDRVVATLDREPAPRLIPCGILAEIAYVLEARAGGAVADALLEDLESGVFSVDHAERHGRIRHLVRRYADLELGFSDAAVIACAEDRGRRVLTLDRRHLEVVAREGTIEVLP